MMAAMPMPDVALVSDDLILASRLRSVLAPAVPRVLSGVEGAPETGTIFVDLNRDVEARLALIGALHDRGGARIIGFCQHDDRDVRVRAMAQGADQVVTNGALQQAAVRLVGGLPDD